MSLEPILDFPWVHVEARSDDNFLTASYQVDKPFLIHDAQVAPSGSIRPPSNDPDVSTGCR